jgi:hypothetical protein
MVYAPIVQHEIEVSALRQSFCCLMNVQDSIAQMWHNILSLLQLTEYLVYRGLMTPIHRNALCLESMRPVHNARPSWNKSSHPVSKDHEERTRIFRGELIRDHRGKVCQHMLANVLVKIDHRRCYHPLSGWSGPCLYPS